MCWTSREERKALEELQLRRADETPVVEVEREEHVVEPEFVDELERDRERELVRA